MADDLVALIRKYLLVVDRARRMRVQKRERLLVLAGIVVICRHEKPS